MIQFAEWGMRSRLSHIWQECFQEPARPARYFLNNCFRPENCLVYRIGDKIAAAVYFLPASVVAGGKAVQAHYIYAAATLPQYRSRGYMASLLAGAAMIGAKRGDQYSVVLPATKQLYPLYQKSDYLPFFQVKTVSVPADRLCVLACSGRAGRTAPDYRLLNSLRSGYLARINGSVLWSDEAFAFAIGMGGVYGDRLVTSSLTANRPAYALCRKIDPDTCRVLEVMADEQTLPDLAANLISEAPARMYEFRLPAQSSLFPGEGELSPFGMVKPIGGALMEPIQPKSGFPYLGLPLD